MTLRRRALLVFFGLTIVPIAIIATLVIYGGHRIVMEQARRELARRLDEISSEVADRLSHWRFITEEVIAESRAPRPFGEDAASWKEARIPRLQGFVAEDPILARIIFLDRGNSGKVETISHEIFGAPSAEMESLPVADLPPLYRRLLLERDDGGAIPDRPLTELRTDGPVLLTITPAGEQDDPESQMVVLEYPATLFVETILDRSARGVLTSSFAAARASDGNRWVYIHNSDPILIGTEVEGPVVGVERTGWSFSRSGDRLVGAGILPETGWLFGGSISLERFVAPLSQVIQISILLIALMAILVIIGILHVTRGLGGVVERIEAATAAYSRGDLSVEIHLDRDDEFGRIAQRINEMCRDLSRSVEARAAARLSSRLVHGLKGVLSQMNLLLYNLRENANDEEFRSESLELLKGLVANLEAIVGKLDRSRREDAARLNESFDLDAIVREVVSRPSILSQRGIRVTLELRSRRPIFTSRDTLAEAIDNIVADSLDTIRDGGALQVASGDLTESRIGRRDATHFLEVRASGIRSRAPLELRTARLALNRVGGEIRIRREEEKAVIRVEVGESGR
jgi:HAMP domain-containing protein